MPRVDRRSFLTQGAALAGAFAGAQLLSACGGKSTRGSRPGDLKELGRALSGNTILPGSPDYATARLVWDSRFDDARPLAVIQVADAADVRTVVQFARAHDLRLIVRSGGHSFAGYSTGDGLVVDLSALTAVEI